MIVFQQFVNILLFLFAIEALKSCYVL
uniref:Uncharacterized protein n=1 Tax=Ciona intestinalis TaxID=7719 RepID=H2Y349_CIOIN